MKKHLKTLLLGILAGLSIGLGGTLFLICKYFGLTVLGAFLFPVGLTLICLLKFNLFTGKIGYLFNNKKDYVLALVIMYVGNFIGALAFGFLVRLISPNILAKTAEVVCKGKLAKTYLTQLGSAFFCGVFVYLAVDVFKNDKLKMYCRIPWLFICIAAFVILGFDHCIANMYYLAVANSYGVDLLKSLVSILVVSLGNSFGALFLNLIKEASIKQGTNIL